MAYGNGDKKLLRKALPVGNASLDMASLPTGKLGDLALLRQRYLSVANDFVDVVFTKEPLKGTMSAGVMESVLVAKQKQVVGLNKAYAEKARLSMPSIIGTVEKIYLGRIFGRLAHCASPIPAATGGKAARKYFNIPENIQDQVSPDTLQKIEDMTKDLGFKGIVALVAQVAVDGDDAGLEPETALVLRAVHADCLERYRKPVFGADPRYTCQIHLDYRVIRGEDDPAKRLDAAAKDLVACILVDGDNKKFRTFLEISNPMPRGKAIRLPVTMSQGALQKFDKNATLGSLIVEIGEETVQVRTVATKELSAERDINSFDNFVSRDFGYKNTIISHRGTP